MCDVIMPIDFSTFGRAVVASPSPSLRRRRPPPSSSSASRSRSRLPIVAQQA